MTDPPFTSGLVCTATGVSAYLTDGMDYFQYQAAVEARRVAEQQRRQRRHRRLLARLVREGPRPRLYMFDVHEYDNYYMVVADSPAAAWQALMHHMRYARQVDPEDRRQWRQASIDQLPDTYELQVFDVGQVVQRDYA